MDIRYVYEAMMRIATAGGKGSQELKIKHLTELKETAAKNRAKVKKLVKQQTRALRGKRRPRGKR